MIDGGPSVARRSLDLRQLGISASAAIVVGVLDLGVLLSLAALIFSGPLSTFLSNGIGMLLVGTGLMCAVFALLSARPAVLIYAQEAPGIIVALVAANIAAAMAGADGATIFATVAAAIALTTLASGAAFLLLGHFRLGSLVRFLPYPVVGGFLAGTGWLLLLGGLGVLLGQQPAIAELPGLLAPALLPQWLPGALYAVLILLTLRRVQHALALPALLVAGVALFYLWLAISGISLAEAQARGWLLGPFPERAALTLLGPATLALVSWPALLSQLGTIATAVAIGAIGLLLNVSGLQLARREEFDLNQELRAAGIAQLVAAPLGAPPGFQTLGLSALAHRMGARSRITGVIAGLIVAGAFFFAAELIALLPKVVLGGLICYLGLAFLAEWLYDAWPQLPRVEYALVVLISLLIALFGMLPGVAAGLLIAVVLFVVAYSRVDVVKHALTGATLKSQVTRGYREQALLRERGAQIAVFQLQGFLFFGTADGLYERVRQRATAADLPALRSVLLDFRLVPGLDFTASLSFAKLRQLAASRGLALVFTGLAPAIRRQLERSLAPASGPLHFEPDLDRGLEWCESQLLAELPGQPPATLRDQLARLAPEAAGLDALLAAFERRAVAPGDYLVRQGDEPEDMYFIETGQVTAQFEAPGQPPRRLETMGGGRAVGELGFYLGRRRTAAVVADEPGQVLRVTRQTLARLAREQPEAAAAFHRIMARLLSERVVHLVETVDALQR